MSNFKVRIKKLTSFAMALIMTASILSVDGLGGSNKASAAGTDTAKADSGGTRYSYSQYGFFGNAQSGRDDYSTFSITMTTSDNVSHDAICIKPKLKNPKDTNVSYERGTQYLAANNYIGTFALSGTKATTATTSKSSVATCIFYTISQYATDVTNCEYTYNSKTNKYQLLGYRFILAHLTLSKLTGDTNWNLNVSDSMQTTVENFAEWCKNNTVPENYYCEAYSYTPSDNSYQTMLIYEADYYEDIPTKGSFKLTKTIDYIVKNGLAGKSGGYSVAGVQYQVAKATNATCTAGKWTWNPQIKITTTAAGVAKANWTSSDSGKSTLTNMSEGDVAVFSESNVSDENNVYCMGSVGLAVAKADSTVKVSWYNVDWETIETYTKVTGNTYSFGSGGKLNKTVKYGNKTYTVLELISINADKEDTGVQVEGVKGMNLTVVKKDNGKYLSGAIYKFEGIDDDGNVWGTWYFKTDSKGEIKFDTDHLVSSFTADKTYDLNTSLVTAGTSYSSNDLPKRTVLTSTTFGFTGGTRYIITQSDRLNMNTEVFMPFSVYQITEVQAPEGYYVDTTSYKIQPTVTDNVYSFKLYNAAKIKTANLSDNTLTLNETAMTASVTVKKSSNGVDLLDGSDTAKELDGTTFALYYNASKTPAVKYSANDSYSRTVTSANGSSLVGYFVVNDGLITAKTGASNLISDDGTAFINLSLGYYELIETKVPSGKGYTLAQPYSFKLTAKNTSEVYTIEVDEPTAGDPVEITIEKENGSGTDGKSLAYTVFEVDYWEGRDESSFTDGSTPTHVWYIQTLAQPSDDGKTTIYKAKLEDDYLLPSWNGNESSNTKSINDSSWNLFEAKKGLLDGAVSIKEVQAADGFNKDSGTVTDGNNEFSDRVYRATIKDGVLTSIYSTDSDSDKAVVTNELTIGITNDEYRADLYFYKTDNQNTPMDNVKFNLALLDGKNVVESYGITTSTVDGNKGYYNTALDDIYFYGGNADESLKNKDLGALIAGKTYRLTELDCDANNGYYKFTNADGNSYIDFTIPTIDEVKNANGTYSEKVGAVTVNSKSYNVRLKVTLDGSRLVAYLYFTSDNKDNELINIKKYNPTISTTVKNSYDDAAKEVTITDTVEYSDLPTGTWTIKGIVMDKTDGTATPLVDDNGNYVMTYKTFTNTSQSGTVDITFGEFKKVNGATYVVYEYLFEGTSKSDLTLVNGAVDTTNVYKDSNGNIVCHAESDDINQTGCIVKIGTTATDSTTNSHVGTVGTSVSLKDVIAYNGVNTKTYYRIYTKLVTSDGKDLTDGEGNLFENTQYVTTTGYSGTVTVTMNIDTSKLAGKTVVFFEYIYEGDTLIAEHTSLTDELQTIYFPKITTVAAFTGTNSKTSLEGSNVSLTDTVSYENLIVGQSYTLSGKLMDKSTGKALLVNGKEVTATATLTPKETSGTATVVFNFDATGLTGKTVVVYQDVLVGSSIVYSEADINNTDQSVSFAKPIVLPNTGSRTGLIVNTLAVLLIGIGLFLCRRKKVQ